MILRSEIKPWLASGNIVFPLNFLDPPRSMKAPVITQIHIRSVLNVTPDAVVNSFGRVLPQVFTRIRVTDASKERVNLRGSSARIMNQVEYGAAYSDVPDAAAAGAAANREFFLALPFNMWKSRRRADYGIPLFEFVDGGSIELNTGPALLSDLATVNSGTFQLFVEVEEQRKREAKSRLCWKDIDITQTEFSVPIGGALRWFAFYNGEKNEPTQAPLAAQNFTSQTLEFSILPREVFRQLYMVEQLSAIHGVDPAAAFTAQDVFETMQAVLLQMVDADQKIPEMPQLASLHVQTDGAITTADLPKYIFSYLADRDISLTQRTLQAPDPGQLQAMLGKYGTIKTAQGKVSGIGEWTKDKARVMPIKLRIPSGA